MPHRPVRASLQGWLLAVLILLPPPGPMGEVHGQSDHKQVLVLYSTRRDAQFSIVGENEFPRILDVGMGRNLDYYSEFIDLTRFSDPTYTEAFREFLRLKYQGVRFDLVVAMQDAAVEFVKSHRDLFHDAPAVFLSNNRALTLGANAAGVVHERKFDGTPALIRLLQPDVRHLFIVTGAAAADKQYETDVRQQLRADSGLTLTFLSGLPTNELERRLSALPERSAVYYVLVTEDGAGDKFHALQYADRVAATANAPTYCWVDSVMDHGVVGGSLYRQKDAIERVGQIALRVLRGEAADTIPVATLDLNMNEVDWRQLRRWRIDEARVPAGTVVRFRDPTVWDRYKVYILSALALLVTQTTLITGLLIQRKRRRRAEEELSGSQSDLRRSYERNRDLGARLLNAQETERSRIAGELHDDVCQRMLLLTFELESLNRASRVEAPAAAALTMAQDIAKSLHDLSHRLHPTRLRMIGLVAALDRFCVELSRTGLAVSYTHENVPSTLAPEAMLCLFRVVQEAAQNAIKYSHAHELAVHLSGASGRLTVTITDNGTGFDVDGAWGKGVGLVSMVERVEAMGGTLDISSTPGAGTCVTATVPAVVTTSPVAMAG